jgi:hypothetical protein
MFNWRWVQLVGGEEGVCLVQLPSASQILCDSDIIFWEMELAALVINKRCHS